MSRHLSTPQCPRCNRIDSVAKVTAIVAAGTQQSNSSNVQISPSLGIDDSDINWVLNYSGVSNTSRSALARQLSFPAKGGDAYAWLWAITVTTCIISAMGGFLSLLLPAILILGTLSMAVSYIHFRGRFRADLLWKGLFYCFRDDVVYVSWDDTQCSPPSLMRTRILKY